MRNLARLGLALLALQSAALAEGASAPPHIYRWVDANGIAHYTTSLDRVPEELRGQPLRHEEVSAQAPAGVDTWVQHERVPEAAQAAGGGASGGDRLAALNAQIAELEQAIAADEALLKGDLRDTSAPSSNETLAQVAERMPGRLAELKKLQAERDALTAAGAK
jgi:hypothetical protein